MTAQYKCQCGYKWSKYVEGGILPARHNNQHSSECPKCRSAYFKWLNYNG